MKIVTPTRWLMLALLWMGLVVGFGTGCAMNKSAPSQSSPQAYRGANGLYGGDVSTVSYEMAEADSAGSGDMVRRSSKAFDKDKTKTMSRAEGEQGAQAPTADRKLIRNAWLTVEVRDDDDFKPTIEKLSKMAERRKGYVQSESSTGATLLVPTDQLDAVVLEIEKMGKITEREITVVDATAQYVDMEIRIANLVKMRARLTELVNQSTSVEEVLQVERELARVTSELERLEGQLRVLSRNTTYATVNVSLRERVRPGPLGWVFYGGYKAVKWLFVWD